MWQRVVLMCYPGAIHPFVFSDCIHNLLINGRGKYRNIIITGPANCGNTFLLRLLEDIFQTFSNPASDKYHWVRAEKAEVVFLKDFCWTSDLIKQNDFLLLLEGHKVHLPAPKSHFSSDLSIEKDTPIFVTSKEAINYIGKYNSTDEQENEMMPIQWHMCQFHKQIHVTNRKMYLHVAPVLQKSSSQVQQNHNFSV